MLQCSSVCCLKTKIKKDITAVNLPLSGIISTRHTSTTSSVEKVFAFSVVLDGVTDSH
jgi:hypothetical protein